MWRRVAGVAFGLVVAMAGIALMEVVGHRLFPPPAGTDMRDAAQVAAIVDRLPVAAKSWVVLAWTLGTFAGACAGVAVSRWRAAAWLVAAGVIAGAILNMLAIPHPVWMQVSGVLLPILAAWGAGRAGMARGQT
jgi:hypothetical protein